MLKAELELSDEQVSVAFQSRFGRAEWLKPYAVEHLKELAQKGVTELAVVAPGFFSDCLETLEEIAEEMKELFMEHGGKSFRYIPCLNDSEEAIDLLKVVAEPWVNAAVRKPKC